MKHIVITWEEKLDDLYFLAGETGSDMESCINEWNDCWLPDIKAKHGRNCSFEIEPIPDDELFKLNEYCESEE